MHVLQSTSAFVRKTVRAYFRTGLSFNRFVLILEFLPWLTINLSARPLKWSWCSKQACMGLSDLASWIVLVITRVAPVGLMLLMEATGASADICMNSTVQ